MNEPKIQEAWLRFTDKYSKHFQDNITIWKDTLQKVAQYIDQNDKKPSQYDKNKEIKHLASWLSHQKHNYSKKNHIMNELKIQEEWRRFTDKYSKYFQDNITIWKNTLQKVAQYINQNDKTPSSSDKNKEIKQLGCWLSNQKKNYSKKIQIMKEPKIQEEWQRFIYNDKYKHYFKK